MQLPPPEWMFGLYQTLPEESSQENLESIKSYYQHTLNSPLEGFVMNSRQLEGYQSLSFNSSQFSDVGSTMEWINKNNFTLV